MSRWRVLRPALAGALFIAAGGATAPRPDPVAALGAVERGEWELRESAGAVRKLCITNPASLLQIRHGAAQCQHFVMESAPRSATIRYTCTGHGHGRTTLTVETARLIRIETQGVADGTPFSDDYEARLVGRCK